MEKMEERMAERDIAGRLIAGIDWTHSGLCAHRLDGQKGVFRSVPLLAEGEYFHKKTAGLPEIFFAKKAAVFLEWLRKGQNGSGREEAGLPLLLVSVPEVFLERREAAAFAIRLEAAVEASGNRVKIFLFSRIQAVWEHCRAVRPFCGIIQILEDETQFLFQPGQGIRISFGSGLSGNGGSRQYYNRPVRYRENNYLMEPGRFLYQEASYASWYQAFYQICKKVFGVSGREKEWSSLALTGDSSCFSCVKKALADMDIAAGPELLTVANNVPAYLLEWFCRVHGTVCEIETFLPEDSRNPDYAREDIWNI